ncbi:MAG: Stp1/IreP family PP2C-type Ser/Thr phosphatase [Myxococcota bacterium]
MFEVAALTDPGLRRSLNEDHYRINEPLGLYVVCDGMGGHAAGEVASRLAADHIEGFVRDTRLGRIAQLPYAPDPTWTRESNRLAMAFRVANRVVYDTAQQNPAFRKMGATGVGALVVGAEVCIAHVGDSRAYRWRDGKLQLLTRDHSWVNELVDEGKLSREEAEVHPERNVVTRAIGTEPDVAVGITLAPFLDGDAVLLCSDGLTDGVAHRKLESTFHAAIDPMRGELRVQWLAAELIRLANQAGGVDNTTVVLVQRCT